MSKVKEQLIRKQEQEFELELSYLEWLRESYDEPSEEEVDDMFRLTKENIYLYLYSVNNPEYNKPKQGA